MPFPTSMVSGSLKADPNGVVRDMSSSPRPHAFPPRATLPIPLFLHKQYFFISMRHGPGFQPMSVLPSYFQRSPPPMSPSWIHPLSARPGFPTRLIKGRKIFRSNSEGRVRASGQENSEPNAIYETPNLSLASGIVASPNLPKPGNENQRLETFLEKIVYNCRFFVLFAVMGALAGSLLCFFKGTMFVYESFAEYFKNCFKGIHTGKVILFLVEALDVYLVGTVMLIFGMGLYTLFIAGIPSTKDDRALSNSSLWGMFHLKERPPWMNINSLDEMKSKLGHVIVMVLLVGMFESSKRIHVSSSLELLAFAGSVALAAVSLLLLHKLNH